MKKRIGLNRRIKHSTESASASQGRAKCRTDRGRSGFSNRVAVDYEFDAAIALAAFGGVVGGHGLRLAESARGHCAGRHAFFREKIAHGIGAALRELLIKIVAADAVGVAFDLQREAFVGKENSRDFGELFAGSGLECGASGIEEDVRHIDDEAAGRVASLQNGIELLQELPSQLGFFVFGLRGGLQCLLGLGLGGVLLVQRGLARLLSLGLLLGGFERCLLRFGFLLGSFLRGLLRFEFHTLGFGFGLFRLNTGLLGFLAVMGLRFSIGASFGFTVFGGFLLRR